MAALGLLMHHVAPKLCNHPLNIRSEPNSLVVRKSALRRLSFRFCLGTLASGREVEVRSGA